MEVHPSAENAMSGDDDVDGAVGQPGADSSTSSSERKRGNISTTTGWGLSRSANVKVMLVGEDRGRHQHRHLLAVAGGFEGGPQRHLRLAEADVAAEQAVHRPRGFHVGFDLLDGAELVGSFLVREGHLELRLPGAVGWEGVALGDLAPGVDLDQLAGHLRHRPSHLAFGAVPVPGPQPAEHGVLPLGAAHIELDSVHVLNRDEDAVAAGVLEVDVLRSAPPSSIERNPWNRPTPWSRWTTSWPGWISRRKAAPASLASVEESLPAPPAAPDRASPKLGSL